MCRGPNGPAFRERWGCDRELPAQQAGNFLDLTDCGLQGQEALRRCPNVTLPRGIGDVLRTFRGWKAGVLVDPGALGDQSAWLVDAWDCLDMILERQRKKADRE